MTRLIRPQADGLYDPALEHDACGIGFVVDMKGRPSHRIVQNGLRVLHNLSHRGATGAEPNTGDGAGVLVQVPDPFFRRLAPELGVELPPPGDYAVGVFFLPRDDQARGRCEALVEETVSEKGQHVLAWRDVPIEATDLGATARACQPVIRQLLIGRGAQTAAGLPFERRLYVIRKLVERRSSGIGTAGDGLYVASLSSRTVSYKGMLTAEQLDGFYPDLGHPTFESGLALVHSRFSTNTFPSWDLSQPFRFLAHNGEINTLRGNVNWMRAREALLTSELFGDDIEALKPVVTEGASDSALLDQTLELLSLGGRALPHAMMMLIPEAWTGQLQMEDANRAFFEYHACLMEPWDGPASVVFTDGRYVGAVLDRNGLRPSRYAVTRDGLCVLASEVGVLEIPPEQISIRDRLQPGRMLLVDMERGRIVSDAEIKAEYAAAAPYGGWLEKHRRYLRHLPPPPSLPPPAAERLLEQQNAFGYTEEDKRLLVGPSAQSGKEPLGSMGNDTPLAVLSERPRPLFDYFKQLFAQVTNPPLDAIREELVTSTDVWLGAERNLLEPTAEACARLRVRNPILDNKDLARIQRLDDATLRTVTLPILFGRGSGAVGLRQALDDLCAAASRAVQDGASIVVLSDRGVDEENVPIPSLLAVAAVHHHLVREGKRTGCGLVLESGEPREPHHFCLLVGYGASAINPYIVFETLDAMIADGSLNGLEPEAAVLRYSEAMRKAIVKVMSKMGISTIQSYCGAQIFEAIGIDREVIDAYFTHTVSRIGGIRLDTIAREAELRHQRAFPHDNVLRPLLDWGGQYQWRREGERHLNNPETITTLQRAVREDNYERFRAFSAAVTGSPASPTTLRDLITLEPAAQPVPLDEVESVESIVRRFKTGAMSFGSISREAHETLAIAMNRLGGKSNTGEGGEDPARYVPDQNGDLRRSAIKQVASGRFGVTSEYLVNADEIQIKMAQGAKPGEGGQLPGHKVDAGIARIRFSTPGVGLISPPPHHDIYSIEDLAQLIYDLKNANPRALINVKLVAEAGVGTIAAGVAKAHADVILISGHDGGTGASPLTSIKHTGLPWELGLSEAHQTLVLNDLRSRVVLETDGQLKTGRDVVVAALLGAEEYGFSTAALIAMGCVMMRVCHLNTCPVGVATQDVRLRKRFSGAVEHVVRYFQFVAREARELMAALGFRSIDEMIGRTDKLNTEARGAHWKAKTVDLGALLTRPDTPSSVGVRKQIEQQHGLEDALDTHLIALCAPALERGEEVEIGMPIRNVHRAVGTMLGSELTRRYGGEGLPDDTIKLHFYGEAGQSFGAFLPRGITLTLEGDANDYLGKGLSGGRLVLFPPSTARYVPEENVITGNVALYGATGGEAYIWGRAGERFAVRNSGVRAVVEGVGDHGCEYMTGGRVVIIGSIGRNFAAGMSGGIAYLLDLSGDAADKCNQEMISLEPFDQSGDVALVRAMVERHVRATKSPRGRWVLDHWDRLRRRFVKVMPHDYARVLREQEERAAG